MTDNKAFVLRKDLTCQLLQFLTQLLNRHGCQLLALFTKGSSQLLGHFDGKLLAQSGSPARLQLQGQYSDQGTDAWQQSVEAAEIEIQ